MVTRDTKMNNIRRTHKLIKCKRQQKSLKTFLSNVTLYITTRKPMVKECERPNCRICLNLHEGSEFLFKEGGRLTIKTNFTCASENVCCNLFRVWT